MAGGPFKTLSTDSLDGTEQLGHAVAQLLLLGDCILLDGDLGAGKTAFARAVIQSRLGTLEDVHSPTFTLVQPYETPAIDIWHCDLYRLASPEACLELGLEDAFETAVTLIEWPERLGTQAPPDALTISIRAFADDSREITLSSKDATWGTRMQAILDE